MPERSNFYDKLDFLGFTALRNELAALGSRKLLLTPGLRLSLNMSLICLPLDSVSLTDAPSGRVSHLTPAGCPTCPSHVTRLSVSHATF